MVTLTETVHAGAFIVSEQEAFYSRDKITVTDTTAMPNAGTVLSKAGVPASMTAAAAAAAGNVGTGTLTPDVTAPVAGSAVNGIYTVILRATGATAAFDVIDPNGVTVGVGNVATVFDGPIKFVLANAGTMTIGDRWFVTVASPAGTELWGVLNLAGASPLNMAAGILFDGFTPAGSGTRKATAIVRDAEVRLSDLTWPAAITQAQINAGVNQLRALGIICR